MRTTSKNCFACSLMALPPRTLSTLVGKQCLLVALSTELARRFNLAKSNFNTNFAMNLFGSTSPVRRIPFVPVSTKPICPDTLNLEKTVDGIANELRQILDVKIAEFKAHVTSPAAEWEAFMESKGVRALRKFEGGKQLAIIRSESVLPFHIVDIFEYVDNVKNASVLDPAINHVKVLKRITDHSWVSCVTLHGQWPMISPREFVDYCHWRLLEDGSVICVRFSMPFDDLKPENDSAVRGWDTLFGYLLRPTEDGTGTDVQTIFDSSPKGDLPTSFINQAMNNQPASLSNLREELTKLQGAGKTRDVTSPATYEDFIAAVHRNYSSL